MEELDKIIFNDADDIYSDAEYQRHQDAEDQAYHDFEGKVVYDENGVQFTSAPAYMNYVIITDKYHIYWHVPCGLSIHYKDNIDFTHKALLNLKDKPFDMSFFAALKDPTLLPGQLEFIWSSAEYVNDKVDRLLNLRVFL